MNRDQIASAALLSILAFQVAPCAPREYLFSGPSVTGRFVVEEHTVATPNPDSERLQLDFSGPPYTFSATANDFSYATDTFGLVAWNNFAAFGFADAYFLFTPTHNFELTLIGESLGLPYTSSLPHDLSAYEGVAHVRFADPGTGQYTEYQITSLVAVPEPSVLWLLLAAGSCCLLRWHS